MCSNENRPYFYKENRKNQSVIVIRPDCKMWSCPECAEMNSKVWAHRIAYGADKLQKSGEPLSFLTLTVHEKWRGWKLGRENWQKNWPKLYARAKRKKSVIYYAMLPEKHQDGTIHHHAIITTEFGTRWWKDNARECGLGYMQEETKVTSIAYAIWYATKYITKSVATDDWPYRVRRANLSRNWPKRPEKNENDDDWKMVKAGKAFSDLMLDYRSIGWQVQIV